MQSSRTYVIGSFLFLMACATWLLWDTPEMEYKQGMRMLGEMPLGEGEFEEMEKEGGIKRQEYEFKLLRDPRTNRIPANIRALELELVKDLPTRAQIQFRTANLNNYVPVGPTQNGGRARAIAFDRRYNGSTNRVMLSGGVSGGIFRSTDGGNTWSFVHPENDVRSVTCLAQDSRPGNEDIWYAGTGEAFNGSTSYPNAVVPGHGILKSVDNGRTWFKLANTADTDPLRFNGAFDIVNRIVVDPRNGDVYAAVHRRIMKSVDGGVNWSTVMGSAVTATSFQGITDMTIAPDGSKIFASFMGRNPDRSLVGVWQSSTGNFNDWTRIAGGVNGQSDSIPGWKGHNRYGRIVMSLAPSNKNIMYVLYENGLTAGGNNPEADLFRCDMSTIPYSWSNLTSALKGKRVTSSSTTDSYLEAQTGYNLCVAVHPTNNNIVFAGGTNIYRSTDAFATDANTVFIGGYSSTTYDDPQRNSHPDIHAFVFDPTNPNRLIVASDGGLEVSADITATKPTWDGLDGQLQTVQYYHVAIDPVTGSRAYAGGCQDNSTTFRDANRLFGTTLSDSNDHYILIGGDGGACGITNKTATETRQWLIGSAQEGQFFRVNLFPPTSSLYTNIKPSGTGTGEFVSYMHMDDDNTDNVYLAFEDTLYRTNNSTTVTSDTWTRMEGVTQNIIGSIFSMATTRGNYVTSNNLFIGTSGGKIYRLSDPRNTSVGAIPVDITPSSMVANSVVYDIAVNPRHDDTVIAVVSNYTDNGQNNIPNIFWTGNANDPNPTWQVIEGNLTLPSVRACAIVAKTTGVEYYVGTSIGLYSTNTISGAGTLWVNEGAGPLKTAVVNSMAYRWKDNTLLVGTHGNGMFAAYIGQSVSVITANNDPIRNDKNFIRAAYPTLANDVIRYEAGNMLNVRNVQVEVSNIAGQILYRSKSAYQNGTVPTAAFPRGTYVLIITSPDRKYQFVQKFIKQ